MKYFSLILLTVFSFSLFAKGASTTSSINTDVLPLYSKVYDDTRDPFEDALAAIDLASKTNRNVLIEIGGTWCTWCHKMDAFLEKNPDVYQALHQEFVVLKVSVSDSNENEAFMKGLPPVLGYPHMYVSTSKGKMLLSKDTAELQENGEYVKPNWLAFIAQWKPSSTNASLSQTASQGQ
jgi:thioredoxin-related protein